MPNTARNSARVWENRGRGHVQHRNPSKQVARKRRVTQQPVFPVSNTPVPVLFSQAEVTSRQFYRLVRQQCEACEILDDRNSELWNLYNTYNTYALISKMLQNFFMGKIKGKEEWIMYIINEVNDCNYLSFRYILEYKCIHLMCLHWMHQKHHSIVVDITSFEVWNVNSLH